MFFFAGVVCDQVLEYARLKPPELCFNRESVSRSWKNLRGTVEESGESSTSGVEEKELVLRCSLQGGFGDEAVYVFDGEGA